ncbi:MAG: hypothetical protein H0T42_25065 [Deltaproteobacteria bacterium]|nr:hypothetical protein [Deltaproteobacteria bacterium]
MKLPATGLEIDVPSGTVGKHSFGDVGHEVVSAATNQFLVEHSKDPDSLEDAKTSSIEAYKNVQAETLADGYAVTYETEKDGKTSHLVKVRRDIGGKSYKCWTSTNDSAQAKAVLDACKTLCK